MERSWNPDGEAVMVKKLGDRMYAARMDVPTRLLPAGWLERIAPSEDVARDLLIRRATELHVDYQEREKKAMTNGAGRWECFRQVDDATFSQKLEKVCADMEELLLRKRLSYGPENLAKFGDMGILIRTSDKLERLAHMEKQSLMSTAVGEDKADAWRDIAGYALLMMLSYELSAEEKDDGSGREV